MKSLTAVEKAKVSGIIRERVGSGTVEVTAATSEVWVSDSGMVEKAPTARVR
ncbi:MAG TPA: hypothetical protein VHX44_16510 [Planctomycetota bacterium]|nr:hypothetical protein [Planctomycetota bacterium]